MKKALKKYSRDNVATALENVNAKEIIQILSEKNEIINEITTVDAIPFGNKIALCDIEMDTDIIKSGYALGKSTKEIKKGKLVHVHNVRSQRINFPEPIINEILRQMNIKED